VSDAAPALFMPTGLPRIYSIGISVNRGRSSPLERIDASFTTKCRRQVLTARACGCRMASDDCSYTVFHEPSLDAFRR
jgi:hypothetical protein